MTIDLSSEDGVRTQFTIWHYAVAGDDITNPVALIAERQDEWLIGWWDHDADWLKRQKVCHGDEPYHRPPAWWALAAIFWETWHNDVEASIARWGERSRGCPKA